MGKYLFLPSGIWCLDFAWRGSVPAGGAKQEVRKPMRVTTGIRNYAENLPSLPQAARLSGKAGARSASTTTTC